MCMHCNKCYKYRKRLVAMNCYNNDRNKKKETVPKLSTVWTNNTHNTHTNEHTNTRQCVYNLCTWFAEQLVTDLYNCVHFYSTRYLFLVLVLRRFSSVLSNSMDFCYGSNAINIHFGAFFIFFFFFFHIHIYIYIRVYETRR